MNTQEREKLSQFLQQLVDVKLTEKDQEADKYISSAISNQPDATYLLVQKCLIQDQALHAAQVQIADLQQQLRQQKNATASGSDFLHNDPWATPKKENSVPGADSYQVPSASDNANFSRMSPQNPGAGFGSSFLGNIASTAAGVVAGSFLYHGIGNLLGHHGSPSSWDQSAADEQVGEQTVINNYYGDSDQLADSDMSDNYFSSNADDSFLDESGFDDFDSDWG
ncbi:DUF2076 domain-containing protein [Methylomarinum vadi]|uniref:DUF2076 domain-containing protein n=1 Tax=Methylomarinum vadi TaxID=438855 RepID=UPI0004DF34DC|nr:DUF2076 domain-containing protein [Methylomarinum vadi]